MPLLNSFYAWLLALAAYGTIDFNDYRLLHTNEKGYSFYFDESGFSSTDNYIVRESMGNYLRAHNIMHLQHLADYSHESVVFGIKSKEGVIIAGISGVIMTGTFQGSKITPLCSIRLFWVDEEYRHQGLGNFLMQQIEDYASKQGCETMLLNTDEIYHTHNFFKKRGFSDLVITPSPKHLGGHAEYHMQKNINQSEIVKVELPDNGYKVFIGHPLQADSLFGLFQWNELFNFRHIRRSLIDSITNFIWTDEAQGYVDFIQEKLKIYRKSQGTAHTENEYTIFITSPDKKIIGGAIGEIQSFSNFGNWCYIDDVSIDIDYRQHQLGRELFKQIDDYARSKNCRYLHVETGEWQARGFYEKVGFKVEATFPRSEYNKNQEWYVLRKYLE